MPTWPTCSESPPTRAVKSVTYLREFQCEVSRVTEAIEAAGAQICYFHPYSTDLHPVEMAFARLKAF
jgi:hypothetical protein